MASFVTPQRKSFPSIARSRSLRNPNISWIHFNQNRYARQRSIESAVIGLSAINRNRLPLFQPPGPRNHSRCRARISRLGCWSRRRNRTLGLQYFRTLRFRSCNRCRRRRARRLYRSRCWLCRANRRWLRRWRRSRYLCRWCGSRCLCNGRRAGGTRFHRGRSRRRRRTAGTRRTRRRPTRRTLRSRRRHAARSRRRNSLRNWRTRFIRRRSWWRRLTRRCRLARWRTGRRRCR